jgi:hypothetical protein
MTDERFFHYSDAVASAQSAEVAVDVYEVWSDTDGRWYVTVPSSWASTLLGRSGDSRDKTYELVYSGVAPRYRGSLT